LNSAAAAFAAVADGVEAVHHGVFEPGRMDVAAFVLGLEELEGFGPGEAAAAFGMMLEDEVYEGLADDHADLGGGARVGAEGAAGAFVGGQSKRRTEDDVAGDGVGDHLLEVCEGDVFVQVYNGGGMLGGEDLAVVMVGDVLLPAFGEEGDELAHELKVLLRPAAVDVVVEGGEVEEASEAAFSNHPPS